MFHVEQNTPSPYQGEGGPPTGGPDEVINVPRGTIVNFTSWNILTGIIIFVAFVNSLVAIVQIWIQKSVGLGFLRESIISPDIPGVAKVMFHGEHYIRAYGLFPHPNILGGFLLMSIVLTLLWVKMFHVKQKQPSTQQRENSATTTSRPNSICGASRLSMFHVEHYSVLRCRTFQFAIYALLAIQLLALTLTFSKSALLGLTISLLFLYCQPFCMFHVEQNTPSPYQGEGGRRPDEVINVPRGTLDGRTVLNNCSTWNNSRLRIIILTILIVMTLTLVFNQDLNQNLNQSFDERLAYLNVSRGTILANPILGAGIGQFVWDMSKYTPVPLEPWQFQPVHNIFLLVWSELGIVGLALFVIFLYNVIRPINNQIVPRETSLPLISSENVPHGTMKNILTTYHKYLQSMIIGFIFIMLWDHYNFDIQQGEAAMWIVFGLAAGISSVAGKKVDN